MRRRRNLRWAPEIRYLGCQLVEENVILDEQMRDISYVTVEINRT
jgi:hypothetical protein